MTLAVESASIFRFLRDVVRYWGSLVTSGAIIGAIGIWQATGHHVNGGVYWAVAIVGLFIAFYRAWNDERVAKEKAIAAAAKPSVTSAQWKELADRFEKKSDSVAAQWTHWSYGNQDFWHLSGGSQQDRTDCENLCRLAGTMLAKSAHVLSEPLAPESDTLKRWLGYLMDHHGALDPGDRLEAVEALASGEKNVIIGGIINRVARKSAAACIHCAACEL